MRKLIYYVSCTVDHFIAREDGTVEPFLMEGPHMTDLMKDFPEAWSHPARVHHGFDAVPNRRFDAVLMGRRTYEIGSLQGLTNPYPSLQQIIVSTSMDRSPDPAVELVKGDPLARVRRLKEERGKDIWLCGGGELASALFPEIDELILKINPVIIGRGIRVFARPVPETHLDLLERKLYDSGYQRLHFRLRREASPTAPPSSPG